MQFTIANHVYTVHITKGPIVRGDKEHTGEAHWRERVLLISGAIPIDKREEVLIHELIEAYEFHFPKPSDPEKLRDWDANVYPMIRADLEKNGGLEALNAMEPTFEVAPDAGSPERLKLLRKYRFPELEHDDDLFELARAMWERRGLDPWTDQFHVRIMPQRDRAVALKIVMNIEGIRTRAHRTKTYAGCSEAEFEYGDLDHPWKAVFRVYRLIGSMKCEFIGEARWHDYFGHDLDALDPIVKQHPHACLAKCAEANALRRAFPEETSDLYSPEEFARQPMKRAAKPLPVSNDQTVEEDAPASANSLHLTLISTGMKNDAERKAFIRDCGERFGVRRDGDDRQFYGFVVKEAMRCRAVTA